MKSVFNVITLFAVLLICGCASFATQEANLKAALSSGSCFTVSMGAVSGSLNGTTISGLAQTLTLCPIAITVVAASAPPAK